MSFLTLDEIQNLITAVPGFPKEGIIFRDITPLLAHPKGISSVVELFYQLIKKQCIQVDVIAAMESRGFLFGVPLAERLDVGFVPIRKPGKLPRAVYSESYSLEYGEDVLEIHQDGIKAGSKVLLVDDLLATGGTALASAKLVKQAGGKLQAILFLMALVGLPGGQKLSDHQHFALLEY